VLDAAPVVHFKPEPEKYRVVVTSNNTRWGTVSTSGGEYAAGESFSVTATPKEGCLLVAFTGNGYVTLTPNQGSNPVTVTVKGPETGTVQAIFSEMVKAPPGILGVGKTTGKLTLQGSMEYVSDPDIKQYAVDNSGGLADETVLVALFKWGSLVATNDYYHDTWSGNASVIWTPPQYSVPVFEATPAGWESVPYVSGLTLPPDDPAAAIGDPCHFAEKGTSTRTWSMPTARLVRTNDNFPGTILSLTEGMAYGRRDDGSLPGTHPGMFFPYTGQRHNGSIGIGQRSQAHYDGYYFLNDNDGSRYVISMSFDNSTYVVTGISTSQKFGMAIRCVPE
jgi:hypothetical protein